MRKLLSGVLTLALPLSVSAHVTPSVTLVRRGDFVKQALPGATQFFEKTLGPGAVSSVRRSTGWTPAAEEARVYVGRVPGGGLAGTVVFLWMPSQHGPVGIAAAFGPDGKILQASVTDIGSEPLTWVRPLLRSGRLSGVEGLALSAAPDPARIADGVLGNMSGYYARVIADGIARAQAIERASAKTDGH
jgi:hypothetical protein